MPDPNRDEIEKLERLYSANPGGRVFTHLAEAYRKAGDLDRASELLEAGLLQHPDYPSAWVVLGRVKVDRGEADGAGAAFRRVLELDRHNLIAIRALGDLAIEAGRFDEARHYLSELIQIDPADLETAERLEQLPEPVDAFEGELETGAGIAPEWAWGDVPIDDAVEASLERERGDDAIEAAHETVAEDDAPEPGIDRDAEAAGERMAEEAEAPETHDAPARGSAPLDAWVESLHIVDPEIALPEASDLMPDEPEFEAVLEADSVVSEADVETLETFESGPEEETAEAEFAIESVDPVGVESGISEEPPVDDAGAETDPETTWWGDPEIHAKVPDPVEWVSQDDWERIAAYGVAWTGPGEPEREVESVPLMETEWGDAGRDEDADEVATETLAEVYAAQGFRAEAAEIYRKLLRRRPEDPRLLSRLSALETERAEPARDEAGFEAAEEAGATAAGQVWLEKIESTWPGGEEQAVAGPTPYAWIESGATEPEAGETIGDRLRGLLAWRPESAPAVEPEPEPTLLLDEVVDDAPLPDFPAFRSVAAGAGTVGHDRQDPDSEDLEMFRSWLKSLRK